MPNRARIHITHVIAPEELGRQVEPRMRNLGNAIGRRAQRAVPKRTFALNDSIRTETVRDGAHVLTEVSVGGPDAPYWEHVEKGTAQQKAQPYLRPALLQSRAGDLNFGGEGPKPRGIRAAPRSRPRRRNRGAS